MTTTLTGHVLVLNASYEPLHQVTPHHAMKMLVREVAVIETAHETDQIGPYQRPLVLRLVRYVTTQWKYQPKANHTPVCSKERIKRRDKMCGYCGGPPETVDHIVPKARGGRVTWENSVAACARCNHLKANRTPEEAGMTLLIVPKAPPMRIA